ncbi:MAG: LemA family protein [bacterium]|nr:LemA family protein [bacterium]
MGKWIVGGIAAFLIMLGVVSYNGLVAQDEGVNSAWSEVQNQLKRRVDLIPNLVNTVRGYAEHERGVFNEVTEARAKISQAVKIDASALANNPLLQKQLLEAQQSLNASLGRLIAVAENYPLLKASENFRALQDELAGTENRVAVARGRAVRATKDYNQSTRTFPTTVVAGAFGFKHKDYYEAPESAQNAPTVTFGK